MVCGQANSDDLERAACENQQLVALPGLTENDSDSAAPTTGTCDFDDGEARRRGKTVVIAGGMSCFCQRRDDK